MRPLFSFALSAALLAAVLTGASVCAAAADEPYAPRASSGYLGSIERLDPALDQLLASNAKIEILAEGFDWSEGPVWFTRGGFLVFSDVPRNVVWKWRELEGISEYLRPSGYTGQVGRGGEPGSNGLTLDSNGRLVLCQHGDRQIARLNSRRRFEALATNYEGKRFNSPNDATIHSSGDIYFTDPPYGLEKGVDDPKKEIPFQGVYRISRRGRVTLLASDISRPNGIALSPDERRLYVAVSDPERAHYLAYDIQPDGTLARGRILLDATPLVAGRKGLPDGIKVDTRGNIWGTGPGGVLVISPDGHHLGTINTGQATANCAWGGDGSVLYITADMYLCRVQTKAKGRLPGPLPER